MQRISNKRIAQINQKGSAISGNYGGGSLGVADLVLIGIGGIIGAGFFLGVGLPIRTAGPSVLFAFLFGAVITSQVIGALASLSVNEPVKGSFMVYTRNYIGTFAGFLEGWSYYLSSVLVIASEAVAMSIFTHMWLPSMQTWIMASAYAIMILMINAFGVKNFGRVESLMSVMKIAALIGFILYIGYRFAVYGHFITGNSVISTFNHSPNNSVYHSGIIGTFRSMLIVLFAYAGIGVFGTATSEMRHPKDIDRAAWYTMAILTVLYILSIGLLLFVIPWYQISTTNSPFVTALLQTGPPFLAQVLNVIILVASFSVMAGSVFSANQILLGLGNANEAPAFVTRIGRNGTPYGALAVTTVGIGLTIVISYLLPAAVYNFLISASSYFTLLNWFLILWAFLSWRHRNRATSKHISSLTFGQPVSSVLTMLFLLVLTGFALAQRDQRLGFYAFLALVCLISFVYYVFFRRADLRGGRSVD